MLKKVGYTKEKTRMSSTVLGLNDTYLFELIVLNTISHLDIRLSKNCAVMENSHQTIKSWGRTKLKFIYQIVLLVQQGQTYTHTHTYHTCTCRVHTCPCTCTCRHTCMWGGRFVNKRNHGTTSEKVLLGENVCCLSRPSFQSRDFPSLPSVAMAKSSPERKRLIWLKVTVSHPGKQGRNPRQELNQRPRRSTVY